MTIPLLPPGPRLLRSVLPRVLYGGLMLFLTVTLGAAAVVRKAFELPADAAEKSLRLFSAQSGLPVLFPTEVTRGVRTHPVSGEFTPREALNRMLAGTVLVAVQDEKTGSLTVKRDNGPNVQ